jgi:hypothetical protein
MNTCVIINTYLAHRQYYLKGIQTFPLFLSYSFNNLWRTNNYRMIVGNLTRKIRMATNRLDCIVLLFQGVKKNHENIIY